MRNAPHAVLLGLVLAAPLPAAAQEPAPETAPQPVPHVTQWLVLDQRVRGPGRAFFQDPVAQQLIDATWNVPKPGDTVARPGGTATWRLGRPTMEGWLQGKQLQRGYAYARITAPAKGTWIMHARGHAWVMVNGERRAGDIYANGWLRLPVHLRRGDNHLLFHVGRGRVRVTFHAPTGRAQFIGADKTLPTFTVGRPIDHWGAIVVANNTGAAIGGEHWGINATIGKTGPITTALPRIGPWSTRKVGFRMRGAAPRASDSSVVVTVSLEQGALHAPIPSHDTARLKIPAVSGTTTRRVTFRSAIDGSIQYYGVKPSTSTELGQALFLSLHGASVEAHGQASAYSAKTWGHVVAPTNRRPFGFDWEQWGRRDALEVLTHAAKRYATNPRRTYLTGHSMGGHGTWQIGVLYPDRFAAIGPSAGWIDFSSYGGARGVAASPDPLVALLSRASSPSKTLRYKRNYAQLGIYILHGDADDNVSVEHARNMRKALGPFHRDFRWHEEPGKKHWWDVNKDEPGADCVDWAPMFDFFAKRIRPPAGTVRHVDFTTPSPGISARCHWVTIEQQVQQLEPSRVNLKLDPHAGRIYGTTSNVARLTLDVSHWPPERALTIVLDAERLTGDLRAPGQNGITLVRGEPGWKPAANAAAPPLAKTPERCGPFKEAFARRFVLVYGTGGSDDENAWASHRARYDAETWRYRGNGDVEVMPDTAFDARAARDRGVICYGNASTNSVLAEFLRDASLGVTAGSFALGQRTVNRDDLAVLACYPRPDSDTALFAVIGGTGIRGMRATNGCPLFVSGVAYPDVIAFGGDVRTTGLAAAVVAGYFGNDWSVEAGEWAWR